MTKHLLAKTIEQTNCILSPTFCSQSFYVAVFPSELGSILTRSYIILEISLQIEFHEANLLFLVALQFLIFFWFSRIWLWLICICTDGVSNCWTAEWFADFLIVFHFLCITCNSFTQSIIQFLLIISRGYISHCLELFHIFPLFFPFLPFI